MSIWSLRTSQSNDPSHWGVLNEDSVRFWIQKGPSDQDRITHCAIGAMAWSLRRWDPPRSASQFSLLKKWYKKEQTGE